MTSPYPEETSTTLKEYKIGDRVWVKIDEQPWWPAEVVEDERDSRPVIVKLFGEENYECVSDPVSICFYNCPMRGKHKLEGLRCSISKDRRLLFKDAMNLAEYGDKKESDTTLSGPLKIEETTAVTLSGPLKVEETTAVSEADSCLSVSMDTKEKLETETTENVNKEMNLTFTCAKSEMECPQNITPKVECGEEGTNLESPCRASEEKLSSPDPQLPCDPLSQFTCGVLVWVKVISFPWWPARVSEVTRRENKLVICVGFFNEDAIEEIKDSKRIKPFDCPEKENFLHKGMHNQSQERVALFRAAYDMAVINTSGGNVSDVCLRRQSVSDLKCSGPVSDSHEVEEPLVTPVRRKRGNGSKGDSSVKRRKTQKDELGSGVASESTEKRKSRSLSRNSQRNENSKCSKKQTKLDMPCKRTSMTKRSKSREKTQGSDPSEENKLPRAINKFKTKGGQTVSKFTKGKDTIKKKTSRPKKKMEGERNEEICKSKNSKSAKVKKLGDLERKAPVCRDSLESDLPVLINHIKARKGRSKNTFLKMKKKKKTKKLWGKEDKQKKTEEEIKDELSGNNERVYTESSSPIPYSGHLDSDHWSGLQNHVSPSQDVGNPMSTVSSLDSTEQISNARIQQLSTEQISNAGIQQLSTEQNSNAGIQQLSTEQNSNAGIQQLSTEQNSNAGIQDLNIPSEDRSREDFDPNLDVDDCYISESDDEDLPDALTPSRHAEIHEKDIIWLKWRGCPVWPAVVRRMEKRKRKIDKISLSMIEPHPWIPKRLRVKYNQKSIFPYNSKDSDLFLDDGNNLEGEARERFTKAVDTIENYMTKRILGTLRKEDMEFMDCHEEVDETCDCSPPPSPVMEGVSPPDSPMSNPSVDSKESVIWLRTEGPKFDPVIASRYEKIKERNQSLVEFLKTNEVKQYLLDILREKRKSDKHLIYKVGRSKEKDRLKNPGFGPIADEEQQEDVFLTMMDWYKQETKHSDKEIPDVNYVIDVWIPEGIVYGLIKLKKYARKKAWEQFEKGVYMTKKEKAEVHRSLLESAKRISPEDVQRYEANIQDRINVIRHESGLQNITL